MSQSLVPLDKKLLALIGTGGINSLGLPKREIMLLDIVVAGTSYIENIHSLKSNIVAGTLLKMIRKPHNEYDEQAIALYFEGNHIGYVPQELNLIISRLMDAGKEFYAKVVGLTEKGNWVRISAQIFMIE